MNKLIDYKIMFDHDKERLAEAVTDALQNGWIPAGGVSVTFNQTAMNENSRYSFFQAMWRTVDIINESVDKDSEVVPLDERPIIPMDFNEYLNENLDGNHPDFHSHYNL